ncbi:HAD family hydrolase [Hamadaea sp. NPDC050747]|uniref:HAD family hydrolase n=1 Tax=Hamadaea sp. NPDC050747 TaxID=3155789 RepID=UPI0033D35943
MPKVVATDLDGTLLHSDVTLSARTKAALRTVKAAGTRVVAATARPARVIDELFGGEALIDLAICGNGSNLYRLGEEPEILHPLPLDVARKVIEEITTIVPGSGFAVETGQRVLFEPGYRYRPALDYRREFVETVADLLTEPFVKLMVWLPDSDPDRAWERLRPAIGELIECTWSAERAPLEIGAAGVSKAATLAALCEGWGVTADEVVAFGDAPNDLPMLAWAGTAYAVANAHPAVLAATSLRAPANDADGVAVVLEELFSGGRAR